MPSEDYEPFANPQGYVSRHLPQDAPPSAPGRPGVPARAGGNLPVPRINEHQSLARERGWGFVDLDTHPLDRQITSLLPADFARRYEAVLVDRSAPLGRDTFVVAYSKPADPEFRREVILSLQSRVGSVRNIQVVYADPEAIRRAVAQWYSDVSETDAEKRKRKTTGTDQNVHLGVVSSTADQSAVKRLNAILDKADALSASDIQMEAGENNLSVRYYVDGRLSEPDHIPLELAEPVMNVIRVRCQMPMDRGAMPESGAFTYARSEDKAEREIRVELIPTIFGTTATLRVQAAEWRDIDDLGMTEYNLDRFRRAIDRESGMVIVTGPTNMGKQVTSYAALDTKRNHTRKIVTIEDPVERRFESGVAQIEIDADLTYPIALRSSLRQSPNVIMIGEIRDPETAHVAVNDGALSGHLILTTLHTEHAIGTVDRLIELGIKPHSLSGALTCVVGQRLVPGLCRRCRVKTAPDRVVLDRLGFDIEKVPASVWTTGSGCSECSDGWKGRVAIHEVLLVSDDLAEAIARHETNKTLTDLAIAAGMVPLREDGAEKAAQGLTTYEAVAAVIPRRLA